MVGVDPDAGDGAGVVLARRGVGGEGAVALVDLADRLGGAVGHEHGGDGGEAA
jgi:hypothetical protein